MTSPTDCIYRWGVLPLWLLLTASLIFRTPIPIDETRYLSVAWEMWQRGDFWVPYLNGQAYSHKPPLLFWLMHAGWVVFGVNDWWPRLVGPLAALANLWLIRKLAEKLWHEQAEAAWMAPWVLVATLLWALFATSTMFDALLTCWVLLSMLGLISVVRGETLKGWLMVAAALGLGILSKGPVVFLHVLPTAILVRFWSPRSLASYSHWFGCLLLASLLGVAIALAWAVPAAMAGGPEYADAILWHQTADRAVGIKIHHRALFWYLPFLPLFLFPWLFWPRVWQGVRENRINSDDGLRFAVVWLLSTILVFSLLPSKQIHYLIPMLPAFALLVARVLAELGQNGPHRGDWMLPGLFGLIGGFLVLLPNVPGLAKLNWVQTVQPDWGLCIVGLGAGLAASVWFRKKLKIAEVSTALVAAILIGFIYFFRYAGSAYDLQPTAMQVKAFTERNIPCAFIGNYQGQLNYLGRLSRPLPVLSFAAMGDWVAQHPDGYLISLERGRPQQAVFLQPHREDWLVIRRAGDYVQVKPM